MEALARLSVRDLSFRYPDGTVALSGVTLDVAGGEFVGLLGSNGSGKTTLLTAMDGLAKGYSGSIKLDGMEIKKVSPKDIYRKIGLVFQNPDIQLFAQSVHEDVAFGPRNMGIPEEEVSSRVEDALKAVEMEGLGAKSIHNLSFGQKKRICIAGLLAMGHEILLLDEPTAGLDPMGEYAMMRLLTDLNKNQGVTVVMASHSVDLVPLFLDRLYILSRGTITRGGTPAEVFTAPEEMAHVKLRLPHIAELIWELREKDSIPFNKLPLTVGEARRMLLNRINGRINAKADEKIEGKGRE